MRSVLERNKRMVKIRSEESDNTPSGPMEQTLTPRDGAMVVRVRPRMWATNLRHNSGIDPLTDPERQHHSAEITSRRSKVNSSSSTPSSLHPSLSPEINNTDNSAETSHRQQKHHQQNHHQHHDELRFPSRHGGYFYGTDNYDKMEKSTTKTRSSVNIMPERKKLPVKRSRSHNI